MIVRIIVGSVARCSCLQQQQYRYFSFKRLPWCVPPSSRERAQQELVKPLDTSLLQASCATDQRVVTASAAPRNIGVVAAMSKSSRIIGVDGKLPWDLPEDRKHFKDLTRDKTLLVGKATFLDTPEERNISHVRHCIVVSTTAPEDLGSEKVHVARSFPEALELAKKLEPNNSSSSNDDDASSAIDCWVGGGERLYKEALQHKSTSEIHLTLVDTEVDLTQPDGSTLAYAMFPQKFRWDRYFQQASRREVPGSPETNAPACSYVLYKRKSR